MELDLLHSKYLINFFNFFLIKINKIHIQKQNEKLFLTILSVKRCFDGFGRYYLK